MILAIHDYPLGPKITCGDLLYCSFRIRVQLYSFMIDESIKYRQNIAGQKSIYLQVHIDVHNKFYSKDFVRVLCKLQNRASYCMQLEMKQNMGIIISASKASKIIFLLFLLMAKVSTTSLLMHTIAHSTRLLFRPKTNNLHLKKFFGVVVS